ncbi:MAG: response regulator [Burkholderiaceae bacterium]|nr:response regulator [Burkholderiaceae bacterium]
MLTALVLTCALPAALGFVLLIQHFYLRELRQIQHDSMVSARAIMQSVDQNIDLGIIAAKSLATSSELDQGDFAGFYRKAQKVIADGFPGSNFVLSTRDSIQVLNTLRPLGAPIPDPASQERIARVFETGKPLISDVFIGGATGRPLVAIHVPVLRDDKVLYVLSVGYLPEQLAGSLRTQQLPANRVAGVFDRKGILIARTWEPEKYVGKPGSPELLKRMRETQEGVIESVTLEGVPVYSMFSRSGHTGWGVAIGVPRSSVLQEVLASLTWLTWLVLALLAAGFGASWTIGRRINAQLSTARDEAEAANSLLRHAEELASNKELRTRAVVENVGEGIITIDEHGIIETFNRAASQIFGYSAQEVVGSNITRLMSAEMGAAHTQGLARFVHGGAARVIGKPGVELPALKKDGSHITVELTVTAIQSGNAYLFVGVLRDVTKQKQVQAELRQAVADARAADTAKSAFLANMSHELRTPMNAVLGMAHLVGMAPLTNDQRRHLDLLRGAGQSLLALLNDILDLSKIESGKIDLHPTSFHLESVLQSVATIMGVNVGDKALELAIGIDPDVPADLIGDPLRLQQILVNLTGNAIKFTPGGAVTLDVQLLQHQSDATLLRFVIRDTGIGISAAQQAKLFQPFVQADPSTTREFGGSGLGLVICKRLAELHGGRIGLESTPGAGSTFTVDLSFQSAAAEVSIPAPSASRPARKRMLILEDHPETKQRLAAAISANGWDVDMVSSCEEAVQAIHRAQQETPYGLLLADWSLPDAQQDRLQQWRAAPPGGVPILLMMSAWERSKLAQSHPHASLRGIITKPVLPGALFESIEELRLFAATATQPAPASPSYQFTGRILLVEDNALNQLVAVGILERYGAKVDVANNGAEAVELVRANPHAYQLVLMDVQMPVMDGYSATRILREQLGLTIPIVAMTAGVMEFERSECRTAGMDDFIAKPIDVEELFEMVKKYL